MNKGDCQGLSRSVGKTEVGLLLGRTPMSRLLEFCIFPSEPRSGKAMRAHKKEFTGNKRTKNPSQRQAAKKTAEKKPDNGE